MNNAVSEPALIEKFESRADVVRQLWDEFMDELRHEHLGSGQPPQSPTVRERLNAAYVGATRSS